MSKDERIKNAKAEAFDIFQQIEQLKFMYNEKLQEIIKIQQEPDTSVKEEPNG